MTDDQFDECIKEHRVTGESLSRIMLRKGYVGEEEFVLTLGEQLRIPHIRVAHCSIPKNVLDEVPETLARRHCILPISISGNKLTLAMADPLDIAALDDLQMLTDFEIRQVIARKSELLAAIDRHYGKNAAQEHID